MKCLHLTPGWRKTATLLSLLFIILQTVQAQDSIVAYSDTVSILADAADDSLWNQSAVPPFSGFDDWEITEDNGMLDFMAHVFGLTGGILLLLTILIFLFPILVIALIIYLKTPGTRYAGNPPCEMPAGEWDSLSWNGSWDSPACCMWVASYCFA